MTLRRITSDKYDTDTKDGYQLVQEDWIAGSIEAIKEYCQAINKEMSKTYKDAGYVGEKVYKIGNELKMIEFRVEALLNPPTYRFDPDDQ